MRHLDSQSSATLREFEGWRSGIHLSHQIAALLLFEVAFYFAYRFGMAFPADYPSPLWFPDSVLLCALLVMPRRTWWIFILAPLPIRFLVGVPEGTPAWFLVSCFLNDSLKGLLSAVVLRNIAGAGMWFSSLAAFTRYLLVAVAVSPALSAFWGAASRVYLGTEFWTAWRQWFLGDALASLVVTPLLVCLVQEFFGVTRMKLRHLEILLMAAGLTLSIHLAFDLGWTNPDRPFLLYLPVPFLIWGACRLGPMGACLVLSMVAVLATFGASMGRGPFALSTSADAILSIQMFLMIPSVPFLLLSVLRAQQSRTDSALRESERRFRSLVDTAPVMVWMSDSNALCAYVNKPWLEFTGGSFERQLGMGYADSLHPQDRERFLREYLSVFQLRGTFTLEHRLRHHDGTYRWVLNHGTPRRGSDGQFLGFIGSCIDIEDRKKTEQELLRLHRALIDAQENERQRIGQELHDDLGQRTVALSIGISLLSQESNGNRKLRAGFLDIQRQVSDIVKDIAQLSHRLRPSILERLGLPDALRDLCGKSRAPAGVEIVFTQQGDFPETVPPGSAIALYRVAQEALRNALAHSESKYIQIQLTSTESTLMMTVEDRGRGFTVHAGTTGLGLSGMAERMKNVGGTLDLRSIPGEGTTVRASLPRAGRPEVLMAVDTDRT